MQSARAREKQAHVSQLAYRSICASICVSPYCDRDKTCQSGWKLQTSLPTLQQTVHKHNSRTRRKHLTVFLESTKSHNNVQLHSAPSSFRMNRKESTVKQDTAPYREGSSFHCHHETLRTCKAATGTDRQISHTPTR